MELIKYMQVIKKYLYGCRNEKGFSPLKQIFIFAISKNNAEKYFRSSSLRTKAHVFLGEVECSDDFYGVCITTEEVSQIIREKYLLKDK